MAITSVPSESVVWSERLALSVSVPLPVFSSVPAVGAEMVAETFETTATSGTVSVPPPARMLASSVNLTFSAATSAVRLACAPLFVKMA